jgi:chromosome partitioning protein
VLAKPFIMMRNDHQDALAAGLGVGEFAPTGKSAEEIRGLWQWAEAKLTGDAAVTEASVSAVEFPIMLAPAPAENAEPARPLITWADSNVSWDACL